jgi:molybdopterin molybdotransferase
MISSQEAVSKILSRRLIMSVEEIDLKYSCGRILAEDVFADIDQPPFDRVAMDGIAINQSRLKHSKAFKIVGIVSAGESSSRLPSGDVCLEIMTGAALPDGADMVIPYECIELEKGFAVIKVDQKHLSSNIHPKGNDYRRGDKVLEKGSVIKAPIAALLASVGKGRVMVQSLPKVRIISTGDELVDIDTKPEPFQIRWSNGMSLFHELVSHGNCEAIILKVRDNEEEIRSAILDALKQSDVLLFTGGVSAGKFDFVPKLLKECHVNQVFHKVAQRPGKPLWFGETDEGKFVFGLPGNPVSCLVNLRRFVIPFLDQAEGVPLTVLKARLSKEVKIEHSLTSYLPIKIQHAEGMLVAHPLKGNGSGDFFQLRDSDGFMELIPQEGSFASGHLAEIFIWGKTYA